MECMALSKMQFIGGILYRLFLLYISRSSGFHSEHKYWVQYILAVLQDVDVDDSEAGHCGASTVAPGKAFFMS